MNSSILRKRNWDSLEEARQSLRATKRMRKWQHSENTNPDFLRKPAVAIPNPYNKPIGLDRELSKPEKQVLALAAGFTPTRRNPQRLYLDGVTQLRHKAKGKVHRGKEPLVKQWFRQMYQCIYEKVPHKLDWEDMNITRAQYDAIVNMSNDSSIQVRIADKGMGLIAMSENWYDAQVKLHLEARQYKAVKKFYHSQFYEYNEVIELGNKACLWDLTVLDKEAMRMAKPCPFYILPKIHKQPAKSRPIAAATRYYNKPLAKAMAKMLNNLLQNWTEEVVINSLQVVNKLEHLQIPPESWLLTYDVEALYPSIDKMDCIDKVMQFIEQEDERSNQEGAHSAFLAAIRETQQHRRKILRRALKCLMNYHYVHYKEETFRQTDGVATGASFAPPLANIYLMQLWKPVWEKYSDMLHLQNRYIDDGFVIIDPSTPKSRIDQLIADLNNAHPNINITHELSQDRCIFLDIYVYKGKRMHEQRKLDTQVYFKPTNKFLWLNAKSSHPQSLLDGVIVGELTRYVRLCTDAKGYKIAKTVLWRSLVKRGYKPDRLKKVFGRVKYRDRLEKLDITAKRGPPRPRGANVKSPYHPMFDIVPWKHVVGSGNGLNYHQYAGLLTASIGKPEKSFARPGRVLYRKGEKLKHMLLSRAQ